MITFRGIEFPPDFEGKTKKAFVTRQNRLDAKVIEVMEPYVPEAKPKYQNHGKMKRSHKQERPGVIVNTEPKARREYYTNKGFSGANRGKYWFRRAVADHKEELLRTAGEEGK